MQQGKISYRQIKDEHSSWRRYLWPWVPKLDWPKENAGIFSDLI